MNLFLVERDLELLVQALSDNRCHNQAKEIVQVLSTVVMDRMGESILKHDGKAMKRAHPHHPLTVWAGSSGQAFRLMYDVAVHCLKEHYYRFNTVSNCKIQLAQLKEFRYSIPNLDNSTYCLCLPDNYVTAAGSKIISDLESTVKLYRHYCFYMKRMQLDKYTRRGLPPWLVEASKIKYIWCSEPVPF